MGRLPEQNARFSFEIIAAAEPALTDMQFAALTCAAKGYCYEAIAARYGVPIGTVKSTLNRARAKANAVMVDHEKGEKA